MDTIEITNASCCECSELFDVLQLNLLDGSTYICDICDMLFATDDDDDDET